jgi:cellulose synthase/poly-beta-1,6-N-acetylglucosamine synthase-like glycosyltransferase
VAYIFDDDGLFDDDGRDSSVSGLARPTPAADPGPSPLLPGYVVEAAMRRLGPEELTLVLKHKLVPAAWLPHRTYFATAADSADADAKHLRLTVVGRIRPGDYRRAVRRVLGTKLLEATTSRLHRQFPRLSNKYGPGVLQKALLVGVFAVILAAIFLLPADLSSLVTGIPLGLFFLCIVALRILCLMPRKQRVLPRSFLFDDELPVYSVLVPLFKETSVLPQLLSALNALDYPAEKLDIKLILEETDIAMQRAVAQHDLAPHFDVVVVPAGSPQTKPRALNYALAFARGELVTIYDAEDLPDSQQLRIAAETFEAAPGDLACLQAELAFFNSDDNWMSRQFAIEYATLFRVVLPALAADKLPLPLGGTSNHFRRSVLEAIGAWDPYNVTEDADLGLRLARAGYRTGVIDSRTLEEANTSIRSWIKQRSRWLKGFLLTWFVHTRHPRVSLRELGFAGFWVTSVMTLGIFMSAALYPIFAIKLIADFLTQPPPENLGTLNDLLTGVALVLFLGGYTVAVLAGRKGLGKRQSRQWALAIASMPVYWMLFMPAAWLALYEALFRPFHWHKTQHGAAKFAERKARPTAP